MIEEADTLFRRRGYLNTALLEVVEKSGASRGSIYFHFPGGKEELGVEVMKRVSDTLTSTVDAAARAGNGDPGQVVLGMAREFGVTLRDSEYESGCPIVPVAIETVPGSEVLRIACDEVFEAWRERVSVRFMEAGIDSTSAEQLALLAISALEGGLVLARTRRDLDPLYRVADTVAQLVRSAVPGNNGAPGPAAA